MPDSPDLTVDVDGAVAVLTLNRPERLNAYTTGMGRLLGQAYRDCDLDESIRVIVLTGSGTAFCAGADIGPDSDPFAAPADASGFSASPIAPAAFELRTPVIAAINGHAIGIGLTMALQADIRIIAEDAKCGVVQIRRGMVADCAAHWTLPTLIGMAKAADILLTGRTFSGTEAAELGIATRALPAEQVLPHALTIAADIATYVAPASAALTKRLMWDTAARHYSPRRVAEVETELHLRVMGSPDSREAMSAWRERRTPRWS